MIFCFVQIAQCISVSLWLFSVHSGALWWAALSSDVTLLCIFRTSSSLALCSPAQPCFSECVSTDSDSVAHVPPANALQLLRHLCSHCVPNLIQLKRRYRRSKLVGALRLAVLLGPRATLGCHLYISRSAIFLVCKTTDGLLSVSHGNPSHDLW